MNIKLHYTIFLLTYCVLGFSGSETTSVQELLTSLENSLPARLRDPTALVENESWSRHADFEKLQSLISHD